MILWGRRLVLHSKSLFSASLLWQLSGASAYASIKATADSRKAISEKLWRDFFSDPSQWCDHRDGKLNSRYPDFKHKKSHRGLWLNNASNPPWVEAALVEIAPRVLQQNTFSWNVRLQTHVKAGDYGKTLELFREMERDGVSLNRFTFAPVLNACASLGALEEGRRIHEQVIRTGHELDVYVASCLVNMYGKCGRMDDARRVFNKMPTRNVVAWSALILGYSKCGEGQTALELSRQMYAEGVEADPRTFVGILNACACLGALEEGRRVHEQIITQGFESDDFVGNCLVDMYAKCGSIKDAKSVFDKMPRRNVVAWSSIILGYMDSGEGQKALKLFRQMQQDGVDPNPFTFSVVLNACASVAGLEEGRRVHELIVRRGCKVDVFLGSSLIDMYAKCGSIEDARAVFKEMSIHNMVSWTAMLGGYARHGYAKEALEGFQRMCQEDVEVNGATFIAVLSACSHGGLVDEGLAYFDTMTAVFNIFPDVQHYACVVDLLGRAGRLHEGEDLIKRIPSEPVATVWMPLLGACRMHGNMAMGEHGGQHVLGLEFNKVPDSKSAHCMEVRRLRSRKAPRGLKAGE